MMKFTKAFALLLTSFIVVTQTACTHDRQDEQSLSQNEKVSSSKIADSKAQVFNIQSIGKNTEGKLVDFTFVDADGKKSSLSELAKGKVVFLNFWGTWCPPCRAEIPDIIKVVDNLKSKDFVAIGIALERNKESAVDNVASFAKSRNMNYKIFIGSQELAQAYGGIQAVPTTFLIDKDGNIVKTIQGSQSYETFMDEISKILK